MKPDSSPNVSSRIFAIGPTEFVVQEAFEMRWCCSGSYLSSLTPRTIVMSGSVAGAEMTTFFAPAVEVLRGAFAVGEEAGRLDDDVDAHVLPGQRRGVALREHPERLAVDRDLVLRVADVRVEDAVRRVVLEHVGEHVGVARSLTATISKPGFFFRYAR